MELQKDHWQYIETGQSGLLHFGNPTKAAIKKPLLL